MPVNHRTAYEVANTVGDAMDHATAHWKNRTGAATAYGAPYADAKKVENKIKTKNEKN